MHVILQWEPNKIMINNSVYNFLSDNQNIFHLIRLINISTFYNPTEIL